MLDFSYEARPTVSPSMSLDNLHPFAGQHAIQSAAFAVDFSAELNVSEIAQIRSAAVELKAEFPSIADQHLTTVSLQFNPGRQNPPAVPAAAHDIGGFVMQQSGSETVPPVSIRQIVVSRGNVVIAINDYTRWVKFRSDVERYLSILLRGVNSQKGIAGVALQFSDVFVWRADPEDLDLKKVFSTTTQYLTPSVFNRGAMLWHSHHGYIVEQERPVEFSRLDNVNISCNMVGGIPQLQILISHKAVFQKALYKILDVNKLKVSEIMESLHKKNKEILADILSKEVQVKINLNSSKD